MGPPRFSTCKMPLTFDTILIRWHKVLGLQRQAPASWHRARLREELLERRLAPTRIARVGETSDVLFSVSRAAYDGFPIRTRRTLVLSRTGFAYAYMFAKYTSRWGFYRVLARLCRRPAPRAVREVVNPSKDAKLGEVAVRNGMDPAAFTKVGRRLRLVWPLLP
jgi:hypothetical protein